MLQHEIRGAHENLKKNLVNRIVGNADVLGNKSARVRPLLVFFVRSIPAGITWRDANPAAAGNMGQHECDRCLSPPPNDELNEWPQWNAHNASLDWLFGRSRGWRSCNFSDKFSIGCMIDL